MVEYRLSFCCAVRTVPAAREVAAEQEFAVQNVSLGHLRRQSKSLAAKG